MAKLKARITQDAEKLWNCTAMQATNPAERVAAKPLPKRAGQFVTLEPEEFTREEMVEKFASNGLCQGNRFWFRCEDDDQYGRWVCEHQIDLETVRNVGNG